MHSFIQWWLFFWGPRFPSAPSHLLFRILFSATAFYNGIKGWMKAETVQGHALAQSETSNVFTRSFESLFKTTLPLAIPCVRRHWIGLLETMWNGEWYPRLEETGWTNAKFELLNDLIGRHLNHRLITGVSLCWCPANEPEQIQYYLMRPHNTILWVPGKKTRKICSNDVSKEALVLVYTFMKGVFLMIMEICRRDK